MQKGKPLKIEGHFFILFRCRRSIPGCCLARWMTFQLQLILQAFHSTVNFTLQIKASSLFLRVDFKQVIVLFLEGRQFQLRRLHVQNLAGLIKVDSTRFVARSLTGACPNAGAGGLSVCLCECFSENLGSGNYYLYE